MLLWASREVIKLLDLKGTWTKAPHKVAAALNLNPSKFSPSAQKTGEVDGRAK